MSPLIKNIKVLHRVNNYSKKGYQPRTNRVTVEKGDFVIDSHNILARWRKHFSQLFNVHGVNDVRQTDIHTVEPLVPELSAFQIEMAVENLKRHKSPGIDQIPAELIIAGDRKIRSKIHNPINSIWKK